MRRTGWVMVALVPALITALASSACRPEESVTPVPRGPYVALGDLYAAGPGIPVSTGRPPGCARSSGNYPALIAADGRYATVRDVSCAARACATWPVRR